MPCVQSSPEGLTSRVYPILSCKADESSAIVRAAALPLLPAFEWLGTRLLVLLLTSALLSPDLLLLMLLLLLLLLLLLGAVDESCGLTLELLEVIASGDVDAEVSDEDEEDWLEPFSCVLGTAGRFERESEAPMAAASPRGRLVFGAASAAACSFCRRSAYVQTKHYPASPMFACCE